MLTDEQFSNFEKNEISFKLSSNGKFANIYSKNKFAGFIFSTNTTVYFCGQKFISTTGKEIIDFLKTQYSDMTETVIFSNDEAFEIWKKCVSEKIPVSQIEIAVGVKTNYLYNLFKRLKLPRTFKEWQLMDESLLSNILAQNCYNSAKIFLEKI